MLRTVQSVRPAPVFSKIDKATILSSFKPAAQSEYVLSDDERTLTKIGPADSSSRSFEVTGKPRPGAKCFMRVKVNGPSYSVIVISPELITATNHVAWTTGSLPANVWIDVKVEHVSGQTYKYTVGGTVLYTGTAQHMAFYGHSAVTQISVDTGQLGSPLPAGFEWL